MLNTIPFPDIWAKSTEWLILISQKAFEIAVIIIIALILLKLRKAAIKKLFNMTKWDEKKEQTLSSVLMSTSKYIISVIAALMILSELGAEIGPILAGAGIVGLAVGFGAQNLVKDIITGFFIMFEDQFHVGDYVEINGEITGTVEELGLRMTKIREWGGHVNYIGNSSIQRVKNYNREKMRALISVIIPYEEDHKKVKQVIDQLCKEMSETHKEHFVQDQEGNIAEPPQLYGIVDIEKNQLGAKYTIIGLAKDTSYFFICKEIRRLILEKFNENNIRIAYPKRIYENTLPIDR